MSALDEVFGAARAILGQAPSAEGFASLLGLVVELDQGEAHEKLVPYLERTLEAWPSALRALPDELARALVLDGECDARARLCRRLDWVIASPSDSRKMNGGVGGRRLRDALELHGGLEHLELKGNALGGAGAEALFASEAMAKVRHLDVRYNALGDAGASALASAPFERLEALLLRRNTIKSKGISALARAGIGPLRHLGLGYNRAGKSAGRALVESSVLDGARYVDLGYNYLGEDNVEALLTSGKIEDVTHLNLRQNALGDRVVDVLVDVDFQRLTHLSLCNNSISRSAMERLARSSALPALECIDEDVFPVWGASEFIAISTRAGVHPNLVDRPFYWGVE